MGWPLMAGLSVRVRVTDDNTDARLADIRRAVEVGIAAAIPGVIAVADRNVRGYSRRVARGLISLQVGPATWKIIGSHPISHIVENGARQVAARPFLVPALMSSRVDVVRRIIDAARA